MGLGNDGFGGRIGAFWVERPRESHQAWARQHGFRAHEPALLAQAREHRFLAGLIRSERSMPAFARNHVPAALGRNERSHAKAGTGTKCKLHAFAGERAFSKRARVPGAKPW